MTDLVPSEAREQQTVAMWLDAHRIDYFHVPNETGTAHGYGLRLKMARLGVKPGVPDIVIIEPPPLVLGAAGAVIEMKRVRGSKTTEAQLEWLERFKRRGWAWAICKGADDALARLAEWGYGQRVKRF